MRKAGRADLSKAFHYHIVARTSTAELEGLVRFSWWFDTVLCSQNLVVKFVEVHNI